MNIQELKEFFDKVKERDRDLYKKWYEAILN